MAKGADCNAADSYGNNALALGVNFHHASIVKLLLTNGANEKTRNDALITAASLSNNPKLIELFFETKVADNIKNQAFLKAVEARKCVSTVRLLLDKGANIHALSPKGESAMTLAAGGNCAVWFDGIELLLKQGAASVHMRNKNKETFLMIAIEENFLKIVPFLLEYNIDVNAKNLQGQTALHLAAERGYFDIVRLLLKYGADLNAKDSHGFTPQRIAEIARRVRVVELLASAKNLKDKPKLCFFQATNDKNLRPKDAVLHTARL